jgi:hypothetical protein
MIDILRIHNDFRKMPFFKNTSYKCLNSFESDEKRPEYFYKFLNGDDDVFYSNEIFESLEQEFEWLYNQYCPCCATHHDMIIVNHESVYRNIVKKNEIKIEKLINHVDDDIFEISPEEEEKAKVLKQKEIETYKDVVERYKNKKEENKIYCPYYSKTHTGWVFGLYQILCRNYEEVYSTGKSEYIAKVNLIKPILEKNKAIVSQKDVCVSKVAELISAAAKLEEHIENLQNKIPELEGYAQFLKENKEKTSKIIKSARKLESGGSSIEGKVFTRADQEYWRRVFDEFPGSIFRD